MPGYDCVFVLQIKLFHHVTVLWLSVKVSKTLLKSDIRIVLCLKYFKLCQTFFLLFLVYNIISVKEPFDESGIFKVDAVLMLIKINIL